MSTLTIEESTESMNKALLNLYTSYLPAIRVAIAQCNWSHDKISKPFFMHISEEYVRAPYKILFVGRETYGWEIFDALDDASHSIELYKTVGEDGKHNNSPFWWFRASFSKKMGIEEDFMKATLWTNLSKIDVNKKTPEGDGSGALTQLFIKLLVEEIEIVKPDVVIILTKAEHYNWHLNNYGWLQNEVYTEQKTESEISRESILPKKMDRLSAETKLPKHTYQMAHPNALRRKAGGYNKHANELMQVLITQIEQP